MMVVLVCLGAAIAEGSVFCGFVEVALLAAGILLVVRPLSAWVSLAGYRASFVEKSVIAFFGIRGLGSFYYLAFALGQAEFDHPKLLWVTVCTVVLAV